MSSLNADELHVYECIKAHLEHQVMHERACTSANSLNHCMFVSDVGGSGKSFLIKTITLMSRMWASGTTDSTVGTVTQPFCITPNQKLIWL